MLKNKVIAAILMVLCFILTGCQPSETNDSLIPEDVVVPEEIKYRTVETFVGDYVKKAQGSLSIKYPAAQQLKLETTSQAYVKEILVKRGAKVTKGTVLATFEIKKDEAALAELNLQLERAENAYASGKKNRQDAIATAKQKLTGVSGHDLKIAQLKLDNLQVEYDQYVYQTSRSIAQIKENITELEANAKVDQIVAPFNGVIDTIANYNVGDRVPANVVFFTAYSTEEYSIQAEKSGNKLRYDMRVTVEVGKKNNKEQFSAQVVSAPNILSSTLLQSAATVRVVDSFSFERLPLDTILNTPMYYSEEESVKQVVMVDRSAVHKDDNGSYVYILNDGILQKRYVLCGLSNVDHVWIIDGLTEGQTLVLN